ncbi:hypothetical protein GCM10022222_39440 [Amycolatopsis ultiminotia]|uniref:Uncharacterized protein n=1 Tax=Amycolatopsis ultiminotia TaxID=543629 RepID=A0ABP6WIY2_9PSEU
MFGGLRVEIAGQAEVPQHGPGKLVDGLDAGRYEVEALSTVRDPDAADARQREPIVSLGAEQVAAQDMATANEMTTSPSDVDMPGQTVVGSERRIVQRRRGQRSHHLHGAGLVGEGRDRQHVIKLLPERQVGEASAWPAQLGSRHSAHAVGRDRFGGKRGRCAGHQSFARVHQLVTWSADRGNSQCTGFPPARSLRQAIQLRHDLVSECDVVCAEDAGQPHEPRVRRRQRARAECDSALARRIFGDGLDPTATIAGRK